MLSLSLSHTHTHPRRVMNGIELNFWSAMYYSKGHEDIVTRSTNPIRLETFKKEKSTGTFGAAQPHRTMNWQSA